MAKKKYCYSCGLELAWTLKTLHYNENTGKPVMGEKYFCVKNSGRLWSHPITESEAFSRSMAALHG